MPRRGACPGAFRLSGIHLAVFHSSNKHRSISHNAASFLLLLT